MKTKRIYSRTLAAYLVDAGCNLVRLVPDVEKPNKKVWLFEETTALLEKMSEYTLTRISNK